MKLNNFIKKEVVSPERYNELINSSSAIFIKKTRFLPPSFSSSGFGNFEIEYSVPVKSKVKNDIYPFFNKI